MIGISFLYVDETLNDIDKILTVPTARVWRVQALRVELVTDATIGDRQLAVQFRDASDDVIFEVVPGIVQAANLTINYHFAPHLADLTSARDTTFLMTNIPDLVLGAGFDIRIFDNNTVAALADDMIVQALILELDTA